MFQGTSHCTVALLLILALEIAHAKENDASPEPNRQIFITSKFIETLNEFDSKHQILTDPQFQIIIRQLSQQKDTSILSTPSVTTRSNQQAKIEIIKEVAYPARIKNGQPEIATIETGISLEVDPIIVDDKIQIHGKATVREPDDPNPNIQKDSITNKRNINALSFNTTETVFSSEVNDGETIFLVCRRDKKIEGQLIIALTARIVDPPKEVARTNYFDGQVPLVVSGYIVSHPIVNDPSATLSGPAYTKTLLNDSSPPDQPTLTGIFTDKEFKSLLSAIKKTPSTTPRKLEPQTTRLDKMVGFDSLPFPTQLLPKGSRQSNSLDIKVKGMVGNEHTAERPGTSMTLWDDQWVNKWVAVSYPAASLEESHQTLFFNFTSESDSH